MSAQPCVGKFTIFQVRLIFLSCTFKWLFETVKASNSYPWNASEMSRDTLNHCLKFPLHFIFCHICYGKSEAKNFSTIIKLNWLVSKASKNYFNSMDFFHNSPSFYQLLKIPKKFTQFERKLRKFTGRLNSKISVACTSHRSCQQLRLIFSLRTHRISIRLHIEDYKIPLSLFIISVYICSVLVLWNVFSNVHITVMSCLFLQLDPSSLTSLPK